MQRIKFIGNTEVVGEELEELRTKVYKMNQNVDQICYSEMLNHHSDYDEFGKRITDWLPQSNAVYGQFQIKALHDYLLPIEYLKCSMDKNSDMALLYIHGSAFMRRTRDHNCTTADKIYEMFEDVDVYMPDYRIGLEYSVDETLNDIVDSYEYLLSIGYSPDKIIVLGDSSGATNVLSSLMLFADKQIPAPGYVVVISAMTDTQPKSEDIMKEMDIVFSDNNNLINVARDCFVKNSDYKSPYYSPVHGNYEYFSKINGCNTKILLQVGTAELFLDDSINMFKQLQKQGCDCYLEMYQDMYHDFPMYRSICKMCNVSWNNFMKFVKDDIKK